MCRGRPLRVLSRPGIGTRRKNQRLAAAIVHPVATIFATQTLTEDWGRLRQSKATADEKPNKIGLFGTIRGGVGHRFLIFKTGALNRSATLPDQEFQSLTVAADRTQCERGSKLNRTAFCPGKVSHERAAAAQEFSRTPTSQSLQPDTKIAGALKTGAIK
jgi:hypothetical protein